MLNTAQDWFFLTVLVCTGLAAVSWLTFAQLSMRPMERRMKADGIPNQFKWDGVGARISLYALAIVFPEKFALRFHRLMDVKLIRSYAN